MKKITLLLLTATLLTACHKDNDEPVPEPDPQHTVLVYMSGENNLVSNLADDITEMATGSQLLNENQHLIAFVDSSGASVMPYIAEFSGGSWTKVYQYESDFSAADPAKFREVVEWTVKNYPADDYGLVLWGHAFGWIVANDTVASSRAYGQDTGRDIQGSNTWMNITQMARALQGLPRLKYIFGDCCCMQCVECAYELRDVADYLIGSPAEIPDAGAPYDVFVPALFSESPTFYQDIIDCYYDHYLKAYEGTSYQYLGLSGYSLPLSAIKLSEMDRLAAVTRSAIASFASAYPQDEVLNLDLDGIPFYFGYGGQKVMYDMQGIIKRYAPAAVYTDWAEAYRQAVPYSRMSMKWLTEYSAVRTGFSGFEPDEGQYGCVSMFVPQKSYSNSYYKYNERIRNFGWYYAAANWSDFGW